MCHKNRKIGSKICLGKRKHEIQPLEYQDQFEASAWIDRRNTGGLQYPTKSFYRDCKLMEDLFRQYHKDTYDGLSREPNVTKNFTEILKKKFDQYDEKTLKSFSLVRHMARLKSLQRHLISTAESCRSKSKRIEYQH